MIGAALIIGLAAAAGAVAYWLGLRDGRLDGDEIIEAMEAAHEREIDEAFKAGYAACRAVADGDDLAAVAGPEHVAAQRERGRYREQ